MINNNEGFNSRNGGPFNNHVEQAMWSKLALSVALGCLPRDHEWRVGEGLAVTAFPLLGIPALVIVPWGDEEEAVSWKCGLEVDRERFRAELPVIAYLPDHTNRGDLKEVLRLFRRSEGFVGRLSNREMYDEFCRSSWGTFSDVLQRGNNS